MKCIQLQAGYSEVEKQSELYGLNQQKPAQDNQSVSVGITGLHFLKPCVPQLKHVSEN